MFECHLVQGSVLRKLMEAVVALVNNANIECASSGKAQITCNLWVLGSSSCPLNLYTMYLDFRDPCFHNKMQIICDLCELADLYNAM